MFERTCFRREENTANLHLINKNTSHSMAHTISKVVPVSSTKV